MENGPVRNPIPNTLFHPIAMATILKELLDR
jgi:hypothetical protein